MSNLEWSDYQKRIFEFVETDSPRARKEKFGSESGHGRVQAFAGGGKTTTLVEAAHWLDRSDDALFLAFNKHIEEELSRELKGTGMVAKTVHSCAYGALAGHIDIDVNGWKYNDIVEQYVDNAMDVPGEEKRTIRSNLRRMVSLARLSLTDYTDMDALEELARHYGITPNGWLREIPSIIDMGTRRAEMTGEIDFDDMIWLPVKWNCDFYRNDWVFIDEAQDLNACQRKIVEKSLKSSGRTLWVGDERQAIYGFAGASTDSFQRIDEQYDVTDLNLSICYRCPTSHIDRVKSIVEGIEPAPWADEGTVMRAGLDSLPDIAEPGDYVVCRTNAPLVRHCIRMIQNRRKAVVLGRDIGRKLAGILDDLEEAHVGFDYMELPEYLKEWRREKIEYLEAKDAPESAFNSVRDRYDCLVTCFESFTDCDSLDCLKREINSLFSDDEEGVTFMTAHKVKGDENERVHILRPDLMPLEWEGQKGWEYQQEMNLRYVAMTRSTDTLVFVEENGPEEPVDITDPGEDDEDDS